MAKPAPKAVDNTLPEMPSNSEAEKSILGAVLVDNQALLAARELLQEDDFFVPQNRHIFSVMIELAEAGQAIDLVIVTDKLANQGDLDAAGGVAYISSLADGVARITNVGHYAKIVKEMSIRRSVIHTAANIQQQAFAKEDAIGILAGARIRLNEIAESLPRRGPVPMAQLIDESHDTIDMLMHGKSVSGLPTGFKKLDESLGGLQSSELVILAARPSMGKSALALNIAENLTMRTDQPKNVLLFSLEMNRQSLLTRMIAAVGKIDAHKFRTAHLGQADRNLVMETVANIRPAPLWIDDGSVATVSDLTTAAERIRRRDDGLALVIVDYLQLLTGSRRFSSRQEEVSDISRGLKAMAKNLGVPVLALSQLRRGSEDETPMLSDLRESGAIEQDADVVLFIHRPHFFDAGASNEKRSITELHIAKQRNGPTGMISFTFRSQFTRFEEAMAQNREEEDLWTATGTTH